MNPNQNQYSQLDFFRSWAVGLVVLCHLAVYFGDPVYLKVLQPALLGNLGVLLFFVHTSLVLMLSLDRQKQKFGQKNFLKIFYFRRSMRIYPLSIVVVAAVLIFSLPLAQLTPYSFKSLATIDSLTTFANFALLQNFIKDSNTIGVLWSLPYEIQMYLVFPLFYWTISKFKNKSSDQVVMLGWALFAFAAMLVEPRLENFNKSLSYWQIPSFILYIPCFVAGMLAYTKMSHKKVNGQWPFFFLPLLLAIISIASLLSYNPMKGVFATLILASALPLIAETKSMWVKILSEKIAKYSYGIYLGHYFCMWFSFEVLSSQHGFIQWASFGASMVLLPVAMFHLIEQPMIQLSNNIVDRFMTAKPAEGSEQYEQKSLAS